MLHRDDPAVPVGEIVDALHEHVMAGRVRSIGVSNWNRARRERARELGRRLGVWAAQVALAYALSQPFQPFALAGMRDADAVRAAWTAASLELDAGQREWLAGPNGD